MSTMAYRAFGKALWQGRPTGQKPSALYPASTASLEAKAATHENRAARRRREREQRAAEAKEPDRRPAMIDPATCQPWPGQASPQMTPALVAWLLYVAGPDDQIVSWERSE